MRAIHRLLTIYTIIIVLFVLMFGYAVFTTKNTELDVFSMALSIAMFALIPAGIIYMIWKHHRH